MIAVANHDVWFILAAIAGGAGGVIGAVTKDYSCALVGLGVVLLSLALLL